MKSYPEYRTSKNKWQENIPSHWGEKRFRFLFSLGRGLSITKEDLRESGVPCVNYGEIHSKYGFEIDTNRDDLKCVDESFLESSPSSLLLPGDIVFADTSEDLEGSGNFTQLVNDEIAFAGYHTLIARQSCGNIARYMAYALESDVCRTQIRSSVKGVKVYSITQAILKNVLIPLPRSDEQIEIAAFLDRETSRIDSLIDEKERFIGLLKEKSQALISHVVTKGLDPEAPLNDSGNEWIGLCPKHWEVKRLKHISPKVGVGLVINPSTYTTDEGVYYIFGGDIKEFRVDLTKARRMRQEDSDLLYQSQLSPGDLVSIRVGYPGVTAVVPQDLDGANCASVIIIRKGKFNSDWLCVAMNSDIGKEQVGLASYGAAQKQYNVSDAVEFWFPFPPENEQAQIAKFIQIQNSNLEVLKAEVANSIALLKERKSALISAAVTGKIDVRNQIQ